MSNQELGPPCKKPKLLAEKKKKKKPISIVEAIYLNDMAAVVEWLGVRDRNINEIIRLTDVS